MDINKIKEMLPDYIQGLLSDDDSNSIKKQLEESESLRREYESLRPYFQALRSIEPVKAPDDFLDSVHKRIEAQTGPAGWLKSLFFPLHIKLPIECAGLALTAVLLILIYNPFNPKNIPPVVFDESGVQAEKRKVDKITVASPEEIQKEAIPVTEPDRRLKDKEQPASLVARKSEKPAVDQRKRPAEPAKQDAEAKVNRLYASKDAPRGVAEQNEAAGTEQAPVEPPAPSAPKAGLSLPETETASSAAPVKVYIDEDVAYAENLIAQSDSIVHYKKHPRPKPADIGFLSLAIASAPEKPEEEGLRLMEEKKMAATAEITDSKRKQHSAEKTASASMDEIQPGPENEIIFGQIQSIITSHKGDFSQSGDKPQTHDTRNYIIKISAENIPALKIALEKQGIVREKDFSFDPRKEGIVKFELTVTIQ